MNSRYRDEIANYGASLITYIALYDNEGNELTGGDPAYERQSVTWTNADDGVVRPASDLSFNIPAGTTVAEWRGFNDITGGYDYGGGDLVDESFTEQGIYNLIAAQTGINHSDT